MQRLGLGVVRGKGGYKRLHRMNEGIVSRGRSQGLRHPLSEVGVDDSHLRGEAVVADGVLAIVRPRDHRKRCDLGTGPRGGGNADQVLHLRAESRKIHDTLPDVEEPGREGFHRHLGLLIHEAHHLGGIHRAAAAKRNDRVRLKVNHGIPAPVDAGDGRVRSDLIKHPDSHPIRLEDVQQRVHHAELNHGPVSDDEGPLGALQIPHCLSKDAAFEVD
mmetsp:Transcript_36388/g.86410  ORF Transcript_36388/g.86410 Transcript_36388/m.86410 type:complete len:217 (-) Transcript_36388:1105-1755(-)